MTHVATFTASRYHDFSYGHRVFGHESVCAHLHGHNGRVTFTVRPRGAHGLDGVGRVLDCSAIKSRLCEWLEGEWDHRFLLWEHDPMRDSLRALDPTVVVVPFNPTAENMALYLLRVVGPAQLADTACELCHVRMEETRKCAASASLWKTEEGTK